MIFCVEDDNNIRDLLVYTLETTGFHARGLEDSQELWKALAEEEPELILLDIMLPGEDGYSILEKLKKSSGTRDIPIIMVTAKEAEFDKVRALEAGADDYITKPFSLMALRARAERMRMRTGEGQRETKDTYTDHRYQFLFDQMQFFVDGQEIILSRTEQKLLRTFVWNPGITLSRERLMEILWTDGAKFVEENALSVAVNRLRHKLSGKGDYRPIETVYGIGYVWEKKA